MMKNEYKILGVDPGTNILGFAVIVINQNDVKVQDIGVLKIDSLETHQEKLKEIFLQLQEIIEVYLPSYMAIESPFYGKNIQSMLKLGRAQGVAIAAGITMGLKITEYTPRKVKLSITGNGNASKEQVASMLYRILNFQNNNISLDATDALAVALTHYHQIGKGFTSTGKKTKWKQFIRDHPDRLL